MNHFFILCYCFLLFLDLVPVSLASHASMVHSGLDLKQAYERAKELCPDKLTGEYYGHKAIAKKINSLMAPASAVGDPARKTYVTSYIPNEENISKELQDICGFSTVLPIQKESAGSNTVLENDESLNTSYFDFGKVSVPTKTIDYESFFLFFFGLVVGMFVIFVYNSRLQAAQVPTTKSLRRPEL